MRICEAWYQLKLKVPAQGSVNIDIPGAAAAIEAAALESAFEQSDNTGYIGEPTESASLGNGSC